jgi:hypothetical protein
MTPSGCLIATIVVINPAMNYPKMVIPAEEAVSQ